MTKLVTVDALEEIQRKLDLYMRALDSWVEFGYIQYDTKPAKKLIRELITSLREDEKSWSKTKSFPSDNLSSSN